MAQEAAALLALPARIDQRLAEFPAAGKRVREEMAEAEEELHAVADHHAATSWLELHGVGATAERAMGRAHDRHAAVQRRWASDAHDAVLLREVADELEEAFAALEQAAAGARQIRDHVARLEQAVRDARQRIEAAEAKIDEAWSTIHQLPMDEEGSVARRERLLERASEFVARAREELVKPQPDWLAIVGWAARARQLAEESYARVLPDGEELATLRQLLTTEKERAKGARDLAWALFLAIEPLNPKREPTGLSVTVAERAYQDAVAQEAAAAQLQGQSGETQAIRDAITALRAAEEAALIACERAQPGLVKPARNPDSLAWVDALEATADLADVLVWGAVKHVIDPRNW